MTSPVCTAGNMEAEAGLVHNLLLRCCCAIHSLPCPLRLYRDLSGWVHGLEVRVGTRQSKWGSPSSLPASGVGLWSPRSKSYRLQNCPAPGSSRRHRAPVARLRQSLCAQQQGASSLGRCRSQASDLIVNVGRTLWGHLLHDVHRVPIVPADLLVVRTEDAVCSP